MKNKTIYLIFSFLLLLTKQVVAQFIITQDTTSNQIYKVYSPPLNIIYQSTPTTSLYPNYDMNSDGIADFEFTVHYAPGGNYSNFDAYITPLGQNEIALGSIDTVMESCNNGTPTSTSYALAVPKFFSINDTIKTTQIWQNAAIYFQYSHRAFSCTSYLQTYPPYINKIIGIRLISSSDTIYGWINFYSFSTSFIQISEIAYEDKIPNPASISNPFKISPNPFEISPNPFTNKITIKTDYNMIGSKWELYDQLGQIVLNGKFESTNNLIELDHLSGSLYFLKTEFSTIKIIKINP